MSSDHKQVLQTLLPPGSLWEPAHDDDYDNFLSGRALNDDGVINFLEALANVRDPYRTDILGDLEKEYAIIRNDQLTDDERRAQLATKMYDRSGGGTASELQDKLHRAGFTNLFVHQNSPTVDPDLIINGGWEMLCGDTLSQCGEPSAQCGGHSGDLLVNGNIFSFAIDYTMLCDEPLAQCGEPSAQCGAYSGITRTPIEYEIPDGSDHIFRELFPTPQRVEKNEGVPSDGLYINNSALFSSHGTDVRYLKDWPGLTELTIVAELNFAEQKINEMQTLMSLGVTKIIDDANMEAPSAIGIWAATASTLDKSADYARFGARGMRITGTGGGSLHWAAQGPGKLTPGYSYRATGWARCDGSGAAIPFFDDGSGSLNWEGSAVTSEWQYFDITFLAVDSYVLIGFTGLAPNYVDFDEIYISSTQELTDGDMEDAGTGAWTPIRSAVLTKESSSPAIGSQWLKVAYDGIDHPWALQTVLIPGVKYRVTGWAKGNGSAAPEVITINPTFTSVSSIWVGSPGLFWQRFDVVFTCEATEVNIGLGFFGSSGSVGFDDVDVRRAETQIEVGLVASSAWTGKYPYILSDTAGIREGVAIVPAGPDHKTLICTLDNSGNARFFVDGVQVGLSVTGFTLGSAGSYLHLGNSQRLNDNSGCRQYDVTIYDRVLTNDEIANYNRYTDRSLWSKIFFVGGANVLRDPDTDEILSIEYAQIDAKDKERLHRIILQHKPLHSWCGLCVNYV